MTTAAESTDYAPMIASFRQSPFHDWLGLTLEEVRPEYSRIRLDVNERTPRGAANSVHGGVLATLVDTGALYALFASVPTGSQLNGTAELNISYLRPALGASVVTEATVVKMGRSLAVVEVSISDDQGRLCARGRTTYAVRPTTSS